MEREGLSVLVPPLKTQGIKTRLIPFIRENVELAPDEVWIEPFMGSGAVGFNMAPARARFSDNNPHIIRFYRAIQDGSIDSASVREYLEREGGALMEKGAEHYYEVRDRFNRTGDPLDFLFLNRACFNGVMRFNRAGGFNTPFCRNERRFSRSYITKICNQVDACAAAMKGRDWEFCVRGFVEAIKDAGPKSFIYCDPPYIGRNTNYFAGWDASSEKALNELLKAHGGRWALSTWVGDEERRNEYIDSIWGGCRVLTHEYFYHVGSRSEYRHPVTEALLVNYEAG